MAMRGTLVIKQFKEVGVLKADSDYETLTAKTLIMAHAQRDVKTKMFAVKLEQKAFSGLTDRFENEIALIDFDELSELMSAVKHIVKQAEKMLDQKVDDYTEMEYRTRDEMRVGFYQTTDGEQKAWIDLEPGGEQLFVPTKRLAGLYVMLEKAKEYLLSRGAGT